MQSASLAERDLVEIVSQKSPFLAPEWLFKLFSQVFPNKTVSENYP